MLPSTAYKKGHPGYWKGKKRLPFSAACLEKMRIARTGRKQSDKTIQKRIAHFSGNKSPHWKGGLATVECLSCHEPFKTAPSKGQTFCSRKCRAVYQSQHWTGSNSPHWIDGRTSQNLLLRNSKRMKQWRLHVFQRDDYTCQSCGQRGGELNADHELPFCDFPDLRFEILNGRTLCVSCHKKTPTFGRKANLFHV